MRSLPGVERFDLPSGARYLKIHHYADPSKDAAWLESVRQEMIDTPQDFKRQILMDEDVYDGDPVFPDYSDSRHCPIKYRSEPIPVLPRCMYVGGWDAGQTIHPAFVLLQLTEMHQVHCLMEVVGEPVDSMETFAPLVLRSIQARLPGSWDEVRHVGDGTIVQRSGHRQNETAQSVARSFLSTNIEPMSNVWQPRKSAVDWLLNGMATDTAPRFVLDVSCSTLRKGLQGAYHYETSARGDTVGEGRVMQMPLKDGWSHVQDALQYAAMKVRQIVEKGEGGKVHRRGR